MKWHNLNIGLKLSINSGTALILFLASFFYLMHLVKSSPAVERVFPVASTILVGAFGSFLVKRNSNNKIDLAAKKAGLCQNGEKDPGP